MVLPTFIFSEGLLAIVEYEDVSRLSKIDAASLSSAETWLLNH